MSTSTTSSTEDRALALLGQGCGPEVVASALGVTVSRISQLLSESGFAEQVAELRFKSLAKHSERDQRADRLEDMLLEKLENLLPFMMNPMQVVHAYTRLNAAKRRGSSAPESLTSQQQIVSLNIPTVILNQHLTQNITVNATNQVVKAGNQDLVTVQSGHMSELLRITTASRPTLPNGVTNVP